ncbi:hypothetical protein [Thalassospira xiamenensis]|uniref:hypothetical protein n=1 Tax=Thalassospira xiamenensis TaxID=220697 RepID=UPI001FFF932C|nr:hypothetical protein [Thalassospira xiamenensis]MCK2167159.1 hypothetical protein [Thalassospira xiamenensis]
MEALVNWINNPLVQSTVISPLIGAILGLLFGASNQPPAPSAPQTVANTVVIFKHQVIVQRDRSTSSNNEEWVYIVGLFIFGIAFIWGYSRYANYILQYWLTGAFSCISFIIAAGLVSVIRRQSNYAEWSLYIFLPLLAVGLSQYLIELAEDGIIEGAREAAFRYNLFEYFFNVLKDQHRAWILTQLLGVVLGVGGTLVAALRSLHYLALINPRTTQSLSSFWFSLAFFTRFAARVRGVILLVTLLAAAYFMLSGEAYSLWQQHG